MWEEKTEKMEELGQEATGIKFAMQYAALISVETENTPAERSGLKKCELITATAIILTVAAIVAVILIR